MVKVYQFESNEDRVHIRRLFWEYLQWANTRLNEEYSANRELSIPKAHLRCILIERFDEEELRTLCSDLGVKYDALPGRGRWRSTKPSSVPAILRSLSL
jgi:hypothetical protein